MILISSGFNLTTCIFGFHNFSWSFHEPYFSRKDIYHEPYRVSRTQDYGLKTCKQVPNYLAVS